MRSLPKLIPGVHHKLPDDSQDHVKRIYERAEEQPMELNLYVIGEGGEEDPAPGERGRRRRRRPQLHSPTEDAGA